MQNKPYILVIALLLLTFSYSSCYYDVEEELYPAQFCDTLSVPSYSIVISPIVEQHCTTCHSGVSPSGNLGLESYDEVKVQVDNGLLSCTINHSDDCSPMPDNAPKIDNCEIFQIERWILAGAPND